MLLFYYRCICTSDYMSKMYLWYANKYLSHFILVNCITIIYSIKVKTFCKVTKVKLLSFEGWYEATSWLVYVDLDCLNFSAFSGTFLTKMLISNIAERYLTTICFYLKSATEWKLCQRKN